MTVLVVERPDLPFATFLYANDAAYDDGSLDGAGLASLTVEVLRAATQLPNGQVARELTVDGEIPNVTVNNEGTVVAVAATSSHVSEALGFLAQIVRHPTFDAATLSAGRHVLMARLANRSVRVQAMLRRAARDTIYRGGHSLTQSMSSQEAVLGRFSEESVRGFHANRYRPENSALIVVGAVEASGINSLVAARFSDWTPSGPSAAIADQPPPTLRDPSKIVEIRGVWKGEGQTRITLAMPCVGTSDPDDVIFDVIASMLGKGLLSRSAAVLRHATGDTYFVNASCVERRRSGDFFVEFDTRAEGAAQALASVLTEIHRLRTSTASEADVERAKQEYLGTISARLVTNTGLAHALATKYLYGRSLADLADLEQRVRAITPKDVQRIAAAYLRPDIMGLAVIGPRDVLNSELASYGRINWQGN